MRVHSLFSATVLALLVLPSPAASQDWAAVEIQTQRLADGVYMLVGQGGNMGLSVGPDRAFLIDDQFAPLTDKILAAIRSVTDRPVRFVFNTHWHGDHTGGNENMGKAGALLVAHENARRRMSVDQVLARVGRPAADTSRAAPAGALPVVTLAVMDADTKVIPGHGALSTREDVRAYRDALKSMRDRVAALMGAGRSLDEIQAARPIQEHAQRWSQNEAAERSFVETIYRGLGGR